MRCATLVLSLSLWGMPNASAQRQSSKRPLVGVYGGTGDNTQQKAIESGVDVLFPSIAWYKPNLFMNNIVKKVRAHGIKVYPSLAVAYDGYQEKHHEFAKLHPEYWEKRKDGRLINSGTEVGLSWGHPEVRAYKVRTIARLVETSGVDGVLLDYCRYFGQTAGYADVIVSAFRTQFGKDPNALAPDDPQWIRFRANYVTQFIAELRNALDQIDKDLKIIACVNPDPQDCLNRAMQDWATWLDRGLSSGVVTMIYERDTNNSLQQVMLANEAIQGRVPHMPLIAPYGGNLMTPAMLRDGSLKCLATGTKAVGFYRSDSIFKYHLWDTVAEIAQWSLAGINKWPVNYLLNPDFENNLENWAVGDGNGIGTTQERAKTNKQSLRMRFPGHRSVRQLIDRGFLKGKQALQISVWLDSSNLSPEASVSIEISTNTQNGKEALFRIPIETSDRIGWQRVNAQVSLDDSQELNLIVAGITASAQKGELFVDGMTLNLIESNRVAKNLFIVDARSAITTSKNRNRNLARGQIVKGSSFWDNGYGYDNAVDGDLGNANYGKGAAWHSQRPAMQQWIKIYLPTVEQIGSLRMLNASSESAYRTREYKVEVSTNDYDYTEVARGVLPDDGQTWTVVNVRPIAAKYIKFTGLTGYNLDYAVGLKEIEVYAP
ncbi:MAG: family 10 glycosylhydrolase [Planctomycetota bacterium]|nr:family 10 glycosylhydrolase [Planctomycetota bacterium]